MRPLGPSLPLLLLASLARAGTVVELTAVEVRPTGTQSAASAVPQMTALSLAAPVLPTALTPTVLAPVVAAPVAAVPVEAKAVQALRLGAAKLELPKGEAAGGVTQQNGLNALYGEGLGAASKSDDVVGRERNPEAALLPYRLPVAAPAKDSVPAPVSAKSAASRFPLRRGEITWSRMWALLNPASELNTVKYAYKSNTMLDQEAAMHRHNVAYVFGFRPRSWKDQDVLDRRLKREQELAAYGAKVRAYYGLPAFSTLRPPPVELGAKLGDGGQGAAYRRKDRPDRAIKTFRFASGAQLQEMAAILNAVADQGYPVERVTLVSLPGGEYGLEMRTLNKESGWGDLAMAFRWHGKEAKVKKAVARAEETLHAIGRESEKALGINAADWKAGFGGAVSDDHLENFAYRDDTGEIAGFDPLVKW